MTTKSTKNWIAYPQHCTYWDLLTSTVELLAGCGRSWPHLLWNMWGSMEWHSFNTDSKGRVCVNTIARTVWILPVLTMKLPAYPTPQRNPAPKVIGGDQNQKENGTCWPHIELGQTQEVVVLSFYHYDPLCWFEARNHLNLNHPSKDGHHIHSCLSTKHQCPSIIQGNPWQSPI